MSVTLLMLAVGCWLSWETMSSTELDRIKDQAEVSKLEVRFQDGLTFELRHYLPLGHYFSDYVRFRKFIRSDRICR